MDGSNQYQPGQTIQPGGGSVPPTPPSDVPPVPTTPSPPPQPPAAPPPPLPAVDPAPPSAPEPPVPSTPSAPVEPEAEPVSQDQPEVADSTPNLPPLLSWEASEYIGHSHGIGWYLGVVVATAALVATSLLVFKEWLSAVVTVLMMVALVVYARRAPRVLKYMLNEAGIGIGPKFFPFTQFRSFAILSEHNFFTIELEPLRRFMPRLSIFLDKEDANAVSDALEKHLPREDRKPDAIDRLSRKLKL